MQKYGYFCKSKVVEINLDGGQLQSAKIRTSNNHAILSAHLIVNNQNFLKLFKLSYDEKSNQYQKESLILFQEFQMSDFSKKYKLSRNLEQFIFSDYNEHLIIFDVENQTQEIQLLQHHHFIQCFKLIKNSNLIVSIISHKQDQSQSLEIRNCKQMSNLVQKIDLKHSLSWKIWKLLNFSVYGIRAILSFQKFDDKDQQLKVNKIIGPKGQQKQFFINLSRDSIFKSKIVELNICCDLLSFSNSNFDILKLFNQNKLIRNYSISDVLISYFNADKQQVRLICRNFKGVIFQGLDISTGILNKFPPHFNETRKKVLLTHLFNRIYLENFGEEYEKYEEPPKVNYSSFWNLLNENVNLINIH